MKIGIHYKNGSLEKAFSRLDMMIVIGILAIVLLVKLSVLAGSRQPGQSVMCMNNLRQLGAALLMYSAENNNYFPGRYPAPLTWPERLRPYYKDIQLLKCPGDAAKALANSTNYPAHYAARSYIYNGWNDYFWNRYPRWSLQDTYPFPEAEIPLPRDTIVFGEKEDYSAHFYMDFMEGHGDDFEQVDHAHHYRSQAERSKGGANYTFADGSVRYLRFGDALLPENLWAVDEGFRWAAVVP